MGTVFDSFQMCILSGLNAPVSGSMNGLKVLGGKLLAAMPETRIVYYAYDADLSDVLAGRTALSDEDDQLRVPLVLIGHSYGGSGILRLMRALLAAKRKAAAGFFIDGVPIWSWGLSQATEINVPENAGLAQSYVRTDLTFLPPWSVGIKNRTNVTMPVAGGHNDLPASDVVHSDILFKLTTLRSAIQGIPPVPPVAT